jgi:hypothetical protein
MTYDITSNRHVNSYYIAQHAGTKAFELVCAITIQKNWRGYWCRNLYYEELKHFYKNVSSFALYYYLLAELCVLNNAYFLIRGEVLRPSTRRNFTKKSYHLTRTDWPKR